RPRAASPARFPYTTLFRSSGAGLAAPQIGVDLQVVIFGSDLVNPRYPHALPIPCTVLINPVITPLSDDEDTEGWEGCLSVPGLRSEEHTSELQSRENVVCR